MAERSDFIEQAKVVLAQNDRTTYTQPSAKIYPHQWLWDSCFIAIGLRHQDPKRAMTEINSLFRGQWKNGMLPNIVFNDDPKYATDRNVWRSWVSPFAPDGVSTTGITQPPMVCEAVIRIGEKLSWAERRRWYRQLYPALLKYHQWFYNERDFHKEGLVLLIHPWEVGMDNTPPWMVELHDHQLSTWIRMIQKSKLEKLGFLVRRDTRSVPSSERFDNIEALALFDIQRRLRRKNYDIERILDHSMFTIEDVGFNAILIRNNTLLEQIAKSLNETLPKDLSKRFTKAKSAFNELYDAFSANYYSRDFITHRLIKVPSIGNFLALYSGAIPDDNAEDIVRQLNDKNMYGLKFPVPSMPLNTAWFKPTNYWQGPVWLNTNWLIIDGLTRYGYKKEAAEIREKTQSVVEQSGFFEYFNPENGDGLGIENFSWTAALYIDLALKRSG